MNRRTRKLFWALATFTAAAAASVAWINGSMLNESKTRIFTDAGSIPANDVALVMGTSPVTGGGRWSNPFFESRMDAANDLFRSKKTRHFLLSGDNSRKEYDEPTAMRDALIARGVPKNAITLDYAGFRTLDSVVRARDVFGQSRVTIVTDDFHLARSLFLARSSGLDAVGFSGANVPLKWSKKTRMREVAARVGAWIDVNVLHTKPKFAGPRIVVEIARDR